MAKLIWRWLHFPRRPSHSPFNAPQDPHVTHCSFCSPESSLFTSNRTSIRAAKKLGCTEVESMGSVYWAAVSLRGNASNLLKLSAHFVEPMYMKQIIGQARLLKKVVKPQQRDMQQWVQLNSSARPCWWHWRDNNCIQVHRPTFIEIEPC